MPHPFHIHRIINEPISSNCYVIYGDGFEQCIIVDPGTSESGELLFFLNKNQLYPEYIILTHEHFDHVWGVNRLKDSYDCKVICSAICAAHITDKKKNLSVFYDQVGFECYKPDQLIEEIDYLLNWNGKKIKFIETSGHSSGSICMVIDEMLFSGDTIIYGEKTITKLPDSSRIELIKTIKKLSDFINYPCLVLPGHGNRFVIENREYLLSLDL